LRHEKRCPDVEPEQQVEGRFVDLEKGLRTVEAGIVDEDVETAEAGKGVADNIRAGDVEGQRLRLPAVRRDLARDLAELRSVSGSPRLARRRRRRAPVPWRGRSHGRRR